VLVLDHSNISPNLRLDYAVSIEATPSASERQHHHQSQANTQTNSRLSFPEDNVMAEPKTKQTEASVAAYLDAIDDAQVRTDCLEISQMMQTATKAEPKMWGEHIVGFDTYHYVYASGRSGDWPRVAFSARKKNISLYLSCSIEDSKDLLEKLGKISHGKSCISIKSLADIHKPTLKKLIQASIKHSLKLYPPTETNKPTKKKM
jgi:hypothetical protein